MARDKGAGGPGKKEGFGFHLSIARWKDSKPAELGTARRRKLSPPAWHHLSKAEGGLASSKHNCLAK